MLAAGSYTAHVVSNSLLLFITAHGDRKKQEYGFIVTTFLLKKKKKKKVPSLSISVSPSGLS